MKKTPNSKPWKYLLFAGLLAIGLLVGWRVRNQAALTHLMLKLEYKGDPRHFPGAYFDSRIKEGMTYRQSLSALAGTDYSGVEYYTAPSVQSAETLVVQRVVYDLPWARDVEVNVVYDQSGRARYIELLDFHLDGLRPVSRDDAERRLSNTPQR